MNVRDPLSGWIEPEAYVQWGKQWSPPIENAWLAHIGESLCPDEIIAASRLLFPRFIEYDECVFLDFKFSVDSYNEWKESNYDKNQIELAMNHIHIYDIFIGNQSYPEDSLESLAKIISQTWEISLNEVFKDRDFIVKFSNEESDYGPIVSIQSVR